MTGPIIAKGVGLVAGNWLPWAIGAAAVIAAVAAWTYHERAIGAAELEAKNVKAIAAVRESDAKLSESLLIKLQAENTELRRVTTAAGARIDLLPVVEGSPAEQEAAAAVRCMLDKTLCF
jgi:hypothetical protein